MKILIIDTCGAAGSIALADTDCVPAIMAGASLPGRTASERLVATIKDLSASAGIAVGAVGAVAVVHGPGSFTGVRVGLSAAKGLCEALNVPLLAISRLAVMAEAAGPPPGACVCAAIDAGRGEFYFAEYADGIRQRELLLTRDEVYAAVRAGGAHAEQVVGFEPAVAELLAELSPRMIGEPTAADVLPIAMRRLVRGDFDDAATVDANYLRRTDAEIFAKPRPSVGLRGAELQRETTVR